MPTPRDAIRLYRQLAEEHHRQNHPQERDRYLLLAADAALMAGQKEEAERLRKSLLDQNPHHLLRPYASLSEALKSQDILAYVQQLRRSYPTETAELALEKLRGESTTGPDSKDDLAVPLDAAKTGKTQSKPAPFKVMPAAPANPPKPKVAPGPRVPVDPLPPRPVSRGSLTATKASAASPARAAPLPLTIATERAGVSTGGWVGGALFVLVLAAFLAVIAWILARPLLGLAA